MENKKGVMETLNDYMMSVFDKDKDGIVSFKELMAIFPNYAVAIAILFVDLLVAVAEYRVWDFGYTVTGDPFKAVGFVLVSAVPFYLGQLFWLYPRAIFTQKMIAIGFMAMSLYTSYQFGAADLTMKYDIDSIFGFMLELFVAYVVFTLIYIVIDPTIKKNRAVAVAKDSAEFEEQLQVAARAILESMDKTRRKQMDIAKDFGENETITALSAVRGNKSKKQDNQGQRPPQQQPANTPRVFAETTDGAQSFTNAGSKQDQPPRQNS